MSSYYSLLYERRRRIDCANQPKFFDIFSDIDEDLKKFHGDVSSYHPYQTSYNSNFTTNQYYFEGDNQWFSGDNSIKENYVYRIDNIQKLVVKSINGNENVCNKEILFSDYNIDSLDGDFLNFGLVTSLFDSLVARKDWVPLQEILSKYSPPRNLTWWTDQDLSTITDGEQLAIQALKLGIVANRFIKPTVLMRLDLSLLENDSTFHVPSVIDAFNDPIFSSRKQDQNPTFGTPIDLTNFSLSNSRDFVVRNAPLYAIEIFPISIPISVKSSHFPSKGESDGLFLEILKFYDDNLSTEKHAL